MQYVLITLYLNVLNFLEFIFLNPLVTLGFYNEFIILLGGFDEKDKSFLSGEFLRKKREYQFLLLYYYDGIGLLQPERILPFRATAFYKYQDIITLQKIISFKKFLGYSLDKSR